MSGKFVRASKYRHVFGQASKKELQYENVKVTNNAWDSNLIKTNGRFISVNWNASGGGAFAVIPVNEVGKCPDQIPLFRGHTAQVLDTDFDPFNDHRIASGSDDSKIAIWDIPKGYSIHNNSDEKSDVKDIQPIKVLSGHSRKVGHVLFHPLAQNVLASSSLDYTVKLWNIETGKNIITLKHPDMVTSMSFSYDGNYLATVARDKILRVWNVRENKIVSKGQAHTGAKNQRVVWLGNSDRLATTGFSRLSDRQIGIWDAFNLEKGDLGGFYTIDQSSGIVMPFYDDGNKILYLAGKGDGNIRYYEFQNDELFELSEYQSTEPQRGFAVAPRRMVNVKENEVLRCFKTVVDQYIEPVSFYVPRRSEEFQEDIYPDAPSGRPALTAEEWFSGKSVDGPVLVSMRAIYDGTELTYHEFEKQEQQSPKPDENQGVSDPEEKTEPDEKKKEVQQVQKEQMPALSPSPKAPSINNSLKADGSVNDLLQKASEFDSFNDAEDPSKDTSGWDEDDEKPAPAEVVVSIKPAAKDEKDIKVDLKSSISNATKSESSAIPPKSKTPQPVETSPATPSGQKQEDGTPVKSNLTTNATKSLGLKQSVEKLSSLVLDLEEVVEKLIHSNLEKDERLKILETKIEKMVSGK